MSKSKNDRSENSPQYSNTALFPVTRQSIENFRENLKRHKLDPWLFFNVERYFTSSDRCPTTGIHITDFYGKTITMKGGGYAGAPVGVFWKFIDPFLRDGIVRILNETLETCLKRNWKPDGYIKETATLLKGYLISPIYDYMANIDQKLRRVEEGREIVTKECNYKVLVQRLNGPKILNRSDLIHTTVKRMVNRKDISYETGQMEKFLTEQVNSILQGLPQEQKLTEASGGKIKEEGEKPTINVNISGDVKAENLQIGHDSHIHKQNRNEKKNKRILKKVLKILGAIIVSIIAAVVTDILGDFGLIESIKGFICKMVLGR